MPTNPQIRPSWSNVVYNVAMSILANLRFPSPGLFVLGVLALFMTLDTPRVLAELDAANAICATANSDSGDAAEALDYVPIPECVYACLTAERNVKNFDKLSRCAYSTSKRLRLVVIPSAATYVVAARLPDIVGTIVLLI